MKVLITGARGQLGREFQKIFEKNNINCISLSHNELDITDLNSIRNLPKNITHIINCAAYNNVDDSEKKWKIAYNINGLGVKNLSILSKETKSLLIHFSTDYVFDGKKNTPYTIYDQPNPINKYGESKYFGEKQLYLSHEFILIRPSWIFGSGNNNFIKKVLQWSKRSEIQVADNEVSSPTYAVDLAYATYLLIKKKVLGIFHISNSQANRYDWAKYILNKVEYKGTLKRAKKEDFKLPAKRPGYSVLNNYGLKESINFEMPTWQNAVDRFFNDKKGFSMINLYN